jgi:hypothetical protein
MTHIGYIAGAWGSVAGAIGLYAFATVRRGRRLSKIVPAEDRRWT